jgi:hypothetical protein
MEQFEKEICKDIAILLVEVEEVQAAVNVRLLRSFKI